MITPKDVTRSSIARATPTKLSEIWRSIVLKSLVNRFTILPTGVWSKKETGALSNLHSILLCSLRAALRPITWMMIVRVPVKSMMIMPSVA